METLNWVNISLAILGVAIHSLIKFNKRKDKGCGFCYKYWIKDNVVNTTISVLSTFAILLMLEDVSMFIGGASGLIKLVAFLGGYYNQSLIRAITKKFRDNANIEE
jgi:hypothetical protein